MPEHAFQVHIDLMRPRSLGYVRARSTDPQEKPAIRFNYLKEPQDVADLRASVRLDARDPGAGGDGALCRR